MQLGFDLTFEQLLSRDGLAVVDGHFRRFLKSRDQSDYDALKMFNNVPDSVSSTEYDALIMAITPHLAAFISDLFGLNEARSFSDDDVLSARLCTFRSQFVSAKAASTVPTIDVASWSLTTQWIAASIGCAPDEMTQEQLVDFGLGLSANDDATARLVDWCTGVYHCDEAVQFRQWPVFWQPSKVTDWRVSVTKNADFTRFESANQHLISRDQFTLTPTYWDREQSMIHVDYCRYCHDRSVDYCRTGFLQKKGDPSQGFREDSSGEVLSGCPLDEKISQMHWFKRRHQHISALIAVMIDNPFCAVTGHRICNDCMKSCIFQKQDPVDTPQVESRVLQDVLSLRWGVEIVDLLMKWHPLRREEALPQMSNQRRVLVMGLGPSGFSMLHHLWMRGCAVTGMDGAHLSAWPFGDPMQPIADYSDICEDLSTRKPLGFGGVCEYGITVRWDKNLLNLVYLSLLRRADCALVGDVRFGGTVTVDDAWRLGFDHLVLALGAGLPKALNIPNSLCNGMNQASDFLMMLHSTGAYNPAYPLGTEMALPCVVIGAGLTAVDAATEAQTYYLQLVQTVNLRLSRAIEMTSQSQVKAAFSAHEWTQLQQWAFHGGQLRRLKQEATRRGISPCYRALLSEWGGVHLIYRGQLTASPAYRKNHQELQSALDAGIIFHAQTDVVRANMDTHGSVCELACLQPWFFGGVNWVDRCVYDLKIVGRSLTGRVYCHANLVSGMVFKLSSNVSGSSWLDDIWVLDDVVDDSVSFQPLTARPTLLCTEDKLPEELRLTAPYQQVTLPARHVLVATGSQPNTAFEYEHRGHFERSGVFYARQGIAEDGMALIDVQDSSQAFFTTYARGEQRVSLVGDLHPTYHGSVVKALASSRAAIPSIMLHINALSQRGPSQLDRLPQLRDFQVCVHSVTAVTPTMTWLVLHAPWLSQRVLPGTLYRLRLGYADSGMQSSDSVCLQPSDYDPQEQTISFLFDHRSLAKQELASVSVGQIIGCMGPTGVGISSQKMTKRVLLIADDSRLGSSLLYRRHYASISVGVDYYVQHSQLAAELVRSLPITDVQWMPDNDALFRTQIAKNLSNYSAIVFHGASVYVRDWYRQYHRFCHVDNRVIYNALPELIGYVGGAMQCGLKGICAKCLQWQIDPVTGQRTKAVYACSWQDQPLHLVDLDHTISRDKDLDVFSRLNRVWVNLPSSMPSPSTV
jgi:NADPH-dependent glutamate synthase beta subunit-like oxidoreductase